MTADVDGSSAARRRAGVPIAAMGLALLSALLVVLGPVSYGLSLWSLALGAAYGAAAVVLVLQLVVLRSPSPLRRSHRPLLVTACVLVLLGWLVSRGQPGEGVASPDGRHIAVVDSPFALMEVVTRVQVLESRWTLRIPALSICSQSTDYPVRLRWDEDGSLHVTYGSRQVLATVEVREDGSARLLPSEWFTLC